MAYTELTADDLKARYPAFAAVADETIDYWLTDAARVVDDSWPEASYGPAKMAHAAHMMVEVGVLAGGGSPIPAGVTSFKSGTFSATVSDNLASATGYASTFYGRQFLEMRHAAFAGPRLAWDPPASVG
jgi:hypothetical protein